MSIFDRIEENNGNTKSFLDLVIKYTNIEQLNTEVLNQLLLIE